jgi:hypothetical protein
MGNQLPSHCVRPPISFTELTALHDKLVTSLLNGELQNYVRDLRESYRSCANIQLCRVCKGMTQCGESGCVFATEFRTSSGAPMVIRIAYQQHPVDEPGTPTFVELSNGSLLTWAMEGKRIPFLFMHIYYYAACKDGKLALHCAPPFSKQLLHLISTELGERTYKEWSIDMKAASHRLQVETDWVQRQREDGGNLEAPRPKPLIPPEVLDHGSAEREGSLRNFAANLLPYLRSAYQTKAPTNLGESSLGQIVQSTVEAVYLRTSHHAYLFMDKASQDLPARFEPGALVVWVLMLAGGLMAAQEVLQFHHGALTTNAVAVRRVCGGGYRKVLIRLSRAHLCCPFFGVVPMIMDYADSSTRVRGIHIHPDMQGRGDSDESGVDSPDQCVTADLLQFLHSVVKKGMDPEPMKGPMRALLLRLETAASVFEYDCRTGRPKVNRLVSGDELEEILLDWKHVLGDELHKVEKEDLEGWTQKHTDCLDLSWTPGEPIEQPLPRAPMMEMDGEEEDEEEGGLLGDEGEEVEDEDEDEEGEI